MLKDVEGLIDSKQHKLPADVKNAGPIQRLAVFEGFSAFHAPGGGNTKACFFCMVDKLCA